MGITSPRLGGGGQRQKQRKVGGVRLERKGRRRAGSGEERVGSGSSKKAGINH